MGEINQSGFDKVRWIKLAALAAAPALLGFAWLQPVRAADPKPVDFNKDIKPLLAQNCLKCHKPDPRNPRGPAAGLRLDDKTAAMKGGKSGPAIVPGKSDDSLLLKLLSGPVKVGDKDVSAMPKAMRNQPFKPLPQAKIDLIKRWIDEGAKWPD